MSITARIIAVILNYLDLNGFYTLRLIGVCVEIQR